VSALAAATTFDALDLRRALGRFATGVTIVTCAGEGGAPVGLTANSFNALSLDPPLVLWSLRVSSPSLRAFVGAGHFAINVLAEGQVELSRRFASALADKFDEGGVWSAGIGAAPVLAGCVAVLECERLSQQEAGDHMLFIGRVLRLTAASPATLAPLVFHAGHYHLLGEIL
jgi:flavin reductase (DIM6/NTAB) family NADH-FMN oxidoreductase RutF